MTLQTLANVSSELLPNRVDFSIRFPCFFQKPTNQKNKKIKLSAHGKTKSKHNWIGLEAGGEKKTTTRSNQKCKCATISKCAQNAFNGYKNRQRQQQRQGPRAVEERSEGAEGCKWQTVSGCHRQIWFVRIFLYLYTRSTPKVCGELSTLVCTHWLAGPTTDALAKPIFDLHGKLSAGCTPFSPLASLHPLLCTVFAALWRWQLARGCSNS